VHKRPIGSLAAPEQRQRKNGRSLHVRCTTLHDTECVYAQTSVSGHGRSPECLHHDGIPRRSSRVVLARSDTRRPDLPDSKVNPALVNSTHRAFIDWLLARVWQDKGTSEYGCTSAGTRSIRRRLYMRLCTAHSDSYNLFFARRCGTRGSLQQQRNGCCMQETSTGKQLYTWMMKETGRLRNSASVNMPASFLSGHAGASSHALDGNCGGISTAHCWSFATSQTVSSFRGTTGGTLALHSHIMHDMIVRYCSAAAPAVLLPGSA
jgi:hypothetical protein